MELDARIFIHTRTPVASSVQYPTPNIQTSKFPSFYNFAPCCFPFPAISFRYLSLNSRLRIFPEGDFGMTSVNTTPPFNHLWRALFFSMNCWMERRVTASESSRPVEEGSLTTQARGTSPAASSGMGMTAQSATAGWSRRAASSSAGATWRPYKMEKYGCQLGTST